MNTNESAENYLETILILSQKLPVVRSVDIANEMNFKKSSISVAMKNLREKGHITVSDAGFITLTESGRRIADMIYERHTFISNWLIQLGIDEKTAVEDACRMEHVIYQFQGNISCPSSGICRCPSLGCSSPSPLLSCPSEVSSLVCWLDNSTSIFASS